MLISINVGQSVKKNFERDEKPSLTR